MAEHGPRIVELGRQRDAMIAYLHVMLARGDWHGVSDAANDLREIEREIMVLRGL